jgi:Peptidase M16C associated
MQMVLENRTALKREVIGAGHRFRHVTWRIGCGGDADGPGEEAGSPQWSHKSQFDVAFRVRAMQMVLETKAALESGVIGAGHRFAAKRLDGQRSTAGWLSEQMGGIAYLDFIRDLAKRVDSDWDSVQVAPTPPAALTCLFSVDRKTLF